MLTFETAVKLKEAGFPQPDTAANQFWYESRNGRHRSFFVSEVMSGECLLTYLISGASAVVHSTSTFWPKQAVYCPTVADILPLLPPTYRVGGNGYDFVVWEQTGDETECAVIFHKDMDEACALAWLVLNEKNEAAA